MVSKGLCQGPDSACRSCRLLARQLGRRRHNIRKLRHHHIRHYYDIPHSYVDLNPTKSRQRGLFCHFHPPAPSPTSSPTILKVFKLKTETFSWKIGSVLTITSLALQKSFRCSDLSGTHSVALSNISPLFRHLSWRCYSNLPFYPIPRHRGNRKGTEALRKVHETSLMLSTKQHFSTFIYPPLPISESVEFWCVHDHPRPFRTPATSTIIHPIRPELQGHAVKFHQQRLTPVV